MGRAAQGMRNYEIFIKISFYQNLFHKCLFPEKGKDFTIQKNKMQALPAPAVPVLILLFPVMQKLSGSSALPRNVPPDHIKKSEICTHKSRKPQLSLSENHLLKCSFPGSRSSVALSFKSIFKAKCHPSAIY